MTLFFTAEGKKLFKKLSDSLEFKILLDTISKSIVSKPSSFK